VKTIFIYAQIGPCPSILTPPHAGTREGAAILTRAAQSKEKTA
jgi:hypothetical protein